MKRILSVAVALMGFALFSSAQAQDWAGPSIGIQGGYAWGESKGSLGCSPVPCPVAPYSTHPDGFVAGGHAGYNWQFNQLVVGLEGDAEFADINGSVKGVPPLAYTVKSSSDFDASVRGKAGVAWGRALLYGTGGVAFGDVTHTASCAICLGPGGQFENSNTTRVGWTGGAGVEFKLTPNWELGAEYRYTDLGNHTYVKNSTNVRDTSSFNFSAVRGRLSYRFGAPPPPMVAPPAPMPAAAPAPPPPAPPRTFLVFFDFDKSNLTADARKVVEAAAQTFKANGVARIELTGYTDLAGTQAYNLRLSKRRAETVAAALEKMGVPKSAVNVMWRGKENPRVPTPDGVREPQNRRVEIVMP